MQGSEVKSVHPAPHTTCSIQRVEPSFLPISLSPSLPLLLVLIPKTMGPAPGGMRRDDAQLCMLIVRQGEEES